MTTGNGQRRTWWAMPPMNVEDLAAWVKTADHADVVNHIAELRFEKTAYSNAIEHLNGRLLSITDERDALQARVKDQQDEIGNHECVIRDLRDEVALQKKRVRK